MKANRFQACEHQSVHGSRQEHFLSLGRVEIGSIGEGTRRGETSGGARTLVCPFSTCPSRCYSVVHTNHVKTLIESRSATLNTELITDCRSIKLFRVYEPTSIQASCMVLSNLRS